MSYSCKTSWHNGMILTNRLLVLRSQAYVCPTVTLSPRTVLLDVLSCDSYCGIKALMAVMTALVAKDA